MSSFGSSTISLTGLWRDLLPIASSRRWSTGGGCRCTGFHVALRADAWRRTQVLWKPCRFLFKDGLFVANIWTCYELFIFICIYIHIYIRLYLCISMSLDATTLMWPLPLVQHMQTLMLVMLEVFPAAVEPVLHRCLREPWRGTMAGVDWRWWIISSPKSRTCDTQPVVGASL